MGIALAVQQKAATTIRGYSRSLPLFVPFVFILLSSHPFALPSRRQMRCRLIAKKVATLRKIQCLFALSPLSGTRPLPVCAFFYMSCI
jgi:hypothetical protein